MTPLWVISLFLSLTEIIVGLAVTRAAGGVQVALTTFVIGFPALVATAFFLVLWHRPYVLYPPAEYGNMDVQRYVDAMQRRQTDPKRTLELVENTMRMTAGSPEARQFVDSALTRVKEQMLTIDLSPLTARTGDIIVMPFEADRTVGEFLDYLWFSLSEVVPPYSFGTVWALRDTVSGSMFIDLGRKWATAHRRREDERSLKEAGFKPGMKLEGVRID
jgi:hypothetical protein